MLQEDQNSLWNQIKIFLVLILNSDVLWKHGDRKRNGCPSWPCRHFQDKYGRSRFCLWRLTWIIIIIIKIIVRYLYTCNVQCQNILRSGFTLLCLWINKSVNLLYVSARAVDVLTLQSRLNLSESAVDELKKKNTGVSRSRDLTEHNSRN